MIETVDSHLSYTIVSLWMIKVVIKYNFMSVPLQDQMVFPMEVQ